MKKTGMIYLNSPVVLGLTFAAGALYLLNRLTMGVVNYLLMARFTSWLDPLMYLRFFTCVAVHADSGHFFGNFMLVLVVGPVMEERYGAKRLLIMLAITAFATGLCNAIFFPQYATLGASGLVFMLILLSSFVNMKGTGIPLTIILVGVFYIGNEIINGLFGNDNISQFSHIIGGLCGGAFGFYFKGGAGQARRLTQ